jgi:hypothetical protein
MLSILAHITVIQEEKNVLKASPFVRPVGVV